MAKIGELVKATDGTLLITRKEIIETSCTGCYLRNRGAFECSNLVNGCRGVIFELAPDDIEETKTIQDTANNNGGSTDYYKLPPNATDIMDLIEYRNMNFSMGNIFKACYRMGECDHSDKVRELNKIIWFAQRELNLAKKQQ